jgi:hypothetical protein
MRRKNLFWIAPCIAVLGACASEQIPKAAQACAEWRWIGIKSPQAQAETEDACPDFPGWKSSPAFPSLLHKKADTIRDVDPADPRQARAALAEEMENQDKGNEAKQADHHQAQGARAEEMEGHGKGEGKGKEAKKKEADRELKRFCVYESKKKFGKPGPPTANPKLVRIDQDCAAVSATGGNSQPLPSWQDFSNFFLAQAGQASLDITQQNGVRLAFLDTHPTGGVVPSKPPKGAGTSQHGYTLAHIARNLICSPLTSDRCAAQITTQLALPIRKFNPKSKKLTRIDTKNGGHLGLQSDLADAIVSAVEAWQTDPQAPPHLVLNLSVAWDGDLFGGLGEGQVAEMRAGTQAVYWALRYAADHGVLVLAAAGNRKDCDGDQPGPLLPAAWEGGAPPDGTCSQPLEKPLLYAVGGIDSQGNTLPNARPESLPKRAAYGAYAVVPSLTSGGSTTMYTGSSVATAVASSIAAIVWDTLPGRDSKSIMDLLDQSGTQLPFRANFWFTSSTAALVQPQPQIHRLSLCPSLETACKESDAVGCPLRSTCAKWQPTAFPLDLSWMKHRKKSCDPWLHPQPEEDPCPICNPPTG